MKRDILKNRDGNLSYLLLISNDMTIPNDLLSKRLAQMARSHLTAIHERMDSFDELHFTAILIEAARVIDYENVLMNSREDESYHLP